MRGKEGRLQRCFIGIGILILVYLLVGKLYIHLFVNVPRKAYNITNSSWYNDDNKDDNPIPSRVHISAVLMNHARPHLLLHHSHVLHTLALNLWVSQILILHSNPITAFTNLELSEIIPEPYIQKIQHVDAVQRNIEMGLAIRFYYCANQCTNSWVLHLDDDTELDHSAVHHLVQAMQQNPHRIVGAYGRQYRFWKAPFRYGYDTKDVTGNVEVVLTKALILEKVICEQFLKYKYIVENDLVIPESRPKWNGEDIFVSLVANHYYGNGDYNNYAIPDLHVWEAEDITSSNNSSGIASVSGNWDRQSYSSSWSDIWNAFQQAHRHAAYRGRLWYHTKQRLRLMEIPEKVKNE
jgi:hypothetical protein